MDGGKIFINEAFEYALTLYNKAKRRPYSVHFNSFLVVVIRALCEIYGEPDIINPFLTKNEKGLSGFDANLKRFGYPDEKIETFKIRMQGFYEWAKKESANKIVNVKSKDFLLLQEDLIDMMIWKMKKTDEDESGESFKAFTHLLYTKDNPDPRFKLFSLQVASDQRRIQDYLRNELFKKDNQYTFELIKENVLDPKYYELLGLTSYDITSMSQEKLNSVNAEVLNIIKVDAADLNDEEKLNKALDSYFRAQNTLTSGSGFVDVLLLSSILATLAAVAFIASVFIMR